MEFGERGPLELTATPSGNGTKIGRFVFGVDDRFFRQLFDRLSQSMVLGANDVDIEFDVVAHDVFRLGQILVEFGQHLRQGQPVSRRTFGGDAVDFGRSVRDGETVGLYDSVSARNQLSRSVVQLPSELHQTRPILAVCQRRIPITWQSRRLRIVNQKHPSKLLQELKFGPISRPPFIHLLSSLFLHSMSPSNGRITSSSITASGGNFHACQTAFAMCRASSKRSSGNSTPSQEALQVGPGITEVTRMPSGRNSCLNASVNTPWACLEMLYEGLPVNSFREATEAM